MEIKFFDTVHHITNELLNHFGHPKSIKLAIKKYQNVVYAVKVDNLKYRSCLNYSIFKKS